MTTAIQHRQCETPALLSVVYMLFTKVLMNRITAMLDSNQLIEQAGFWSGYSTSEYIYVINQVVEKYAEYTKPLCMAFIDYEQAFDLVETLAVMKVLR